MKDKAPKKRNWVPNQVDKSYLGAEGGRLDGVAVLHNILLLGHKVMPPFNAYLERQYRISVNQFRVLMLVGRLGYTASHEVASLSGLSTMGVSRAVRALCKRGWVEGTPDTRNRRRLILELTREGKGIYTKMLASTEKVSFYLFEQMRPTDLKEFNRTLITLITRLEAKDENGNSVLLERTRPDG